MTPDAVREVYTDNPFPKRDPEDERRRLVQSDFGYMRLVNSIFWGGKRKIGSGFRVLDAGCGTGDATIHIAEQLKGTGAQVVALDFSPSAIDIVRKRAQIRGIDNIAFHTESLQDIPKLGIGRFDYIVCTAVLQHLENAAEGLKILSGCLKDDGGMGVQLNGLYGRFPIRMLQQAIRMVNKDEPDPAKRLGNAREVLASLSKDHWFKPDEAKRYDEWVYDALLASDTKEYDVPELFALASRADMRIVRFKNRVAYDPAFYTKERLPGVKALPYDKQAALAELLDGRINTHQFFLAKRELPQPDPSDERLVPDYLEKPQITVNGDEALIESHASGVRFTLRMYRRYAKLFELIDGKKSAGEIVRTASELSGIPHEESLKAWLWAYEKTKVIDLIILNRP